MRLKLPPHSDILRTHIFNMAAKVAFCRIAKNVFAFEKTRPHNVLGLTMKTISTSSSRSYPMVPVVIEQTVGWEKVGIRSLGKRSNSSIRLGFVITE